MPAPSYTPGPLSKREAAQFEELGYVLIQTPFDNGRLSRRQDCHVDDTPFLSDPYMLECIEGNTHY